MLLLPFLFIVSSVLTTTVASHEVLSAPPSPDQAVMLAIISGMVPGTLPPSWTPSTSVCAWDGVECTNASVTSVNWDDYGLYGSLKLTALPPHIDSFSVSENYLTSGVINWKVLPPTLTSLDLSSNAFEGTVDTSALPANMQSLDVRDNLFTGTPNFASLPSDLSLYVGSNNFCGTMVNAQQLEATQAMCVGGSDPSSGDRKLACPVCDPKQRTSDLVALLAAVSGITNKDGSWIPTLPACSWAGVTCRRGVVTQVDWSQRGLMGALNMTLPRFTSSLSFSGNEAMALGGWKDLPPFISDVDISQNFFTGLVDLTSLPSSLTQLDMDTNSLRGTPDLSKLPSNLDDLDLSYNDFCGTMTQPSVQNFDTTAMCVGNTDPVVSNGKIVCPAC